MSADLKGLPTSFIQFNLTQSGSFFFTGGGEGGMSRLPMAKTIPALAAGPSRHYLSSRVFATVDFLFTLPMCKHTVVRIKSFFLLHSSRKNRCLAEKVGFVRTDEAKRARTE